VIPDKVISKILFVMCFDKKSAVVVYNYLLLSKQIYFVLHKQGSNLCGNFNFLREIIIPKCYLYGWDHVRKLRYAEESDMNNLQIERYSGGFWIEWLCERAGKNR